LAETDAMFRTVLYELSGDNTAPFYAVLKAMKRRHGARTILVCRTKEERAHFQRIGLADEVISGADIPSLHAGLSTDEIVAKAREAERRFGVNLHYMLIEQRMYFTAAPNFPGGKARDYMAWLAFLLDRIAFFEELIGKHGVTFVLHGNGLVHHVARGLGLPAWRLEACLYELRYLWTDRYDPSFPQIERAYRQEPAVAQDGAEVVVDVKPPSLYSYIRKTIRDSVRLDRVVVGSGREILRHYYYRYRGYDKITKLGFDGWGWARYLRRQRRHYHELRRIAHRKWADVRELPYVFFPLSAEPELTLSFWSPEYFEQLSTIQQLAKELPVGVYLAVKEHMISIGNRPVEFYRTIAKIPNVLLIDPLERGLDLGSTARAVAVIASTAGTEAALHGVPTLVFSCRAWLPVLGHVRAIRRWDEIRPALAAAVNADAAERARYQRDGARLQRALDKVTLDLQPMFAQGEEKAGDILLDRLCEQMAQERAQAAPAAAAGSGRA
jgi:hypothetical protein